MPEVQTAPDFDLISGIPPKPRKGNPNLWIDQTLIDFLDVIAQQHHTDRSNAAAYILSRAREQWQAAKAVADTDAGKKARKLKPEAARLLRQAAQNSGRTEDDIISEAVITFLQAQVEGAYE